MITTLQEILIDQQKDLALNKDKCISRDIEDELQNMLHSSLIKVVMGIRRSGKSTLCTQVAPHDQIAYCNFDDERLTGIQTKDLNAIYEILLQLKPQAHYFIFDEIQNVDYWELFINRLKRKGLNLIITGSNGKLLSQELATHLTGRHLETVLMPFSFMEFLRFHAFKLPQDLQLVSTEERAQIQHYFHMYFENGSFPEVVSGEKADRYLRELFDKIVSRDIVQRQKIRTPKILKQLGLFLIQQSGSLTSLKKLLQIFQYRSVNTLRAHISYLQDTYLIHEVSAYSYKIRERSTSMKKNYACDTGMMAALNVKSSLDLGMRFETLIFLHLKRKHYEIFYLKGTDHDVDFAVVKNNEVLQLIQACYNPYTPGTLERELTSLLHAAKKFKKVNLQVVTLHEERTVQLEGHRIEIIPAWKFCLL